MGQEDVNKRQEQEIRECEMVLGTGWPCLANNINQAMSSRLDWGEGHHPFFFSLS